MNYALVKTFARWGLILLLGLLLAGCGDDDGDFLIQSPNNASTGNLKFQFFQPQATAVSRQAADLEFLFLDHAGDTVLNVILPYADAVTVSNVPTAAVSVEITVYDLDGVPLQVIVDEVRVVGGATITVDLSDAANNAVPLDSLSITPSEVELGLVAGLDAEQQLSLALIFANGDQLPLDPGAATYSSDPPGVVSISENGVVSALAAGNTTITATVTLSDRTSTGTATVSVAGDPASGGL